MSQDWTLMHMRAYTNHFSDQGLIYHYSKAL